MWNNVQEFKDWWTQNRPICPPFKDAIFSTDLVYSLCLFRKGQFQVELYIMKPDSLAPEHGHPNVDSLFTYLGGHMEFRREGFEFYDLSAEQLEQDNGTHKLFGTTGHAFDGELHSVRTAKTGGAFLSFEHWKAEREPDSVLLNWRGSPDSERHEALWEGK